MRICLAIILAMIACSAVAAGEGAADEISIAQSLKRRELISSILKDFCEPSKGDQEIVVDLPSLKAKVGSPWEECNSSTTGLDTETMKILELSKPVMLLSEPKAAERDLQYYRVQHELNDFASPLLLKIKIDERRSELASFTERVVEKEGQLKAKKAHLSEADPKSGDEALKKSVGKLEDEISKYRYQADRERDKIKSLEVQLAESLKKAKSSKTLSPDDLGQENEKYLKELKFIKDRSEYKNCGFTAAEEHAIYDYTGSGYSKVNRALRQKSETAAELRPYVEILESALRKIKPFQGLVLRGATLPPELLEQHKVGQVVTYPAFTSSSLTRGFLYKNHRFVFKSRTGRYVGNLSGLQTEDEVLFPPGAKFKILSREENDENIDFVMEEVE